MKITVKIEDIVIEIERPNFFDYNSDKHSIEFRTNVLNDTVIPVLKEATEKAKELYKISHKDIFT
jgi:hypothetical protein